MQWLHNYFLFLLLYLLTIVFLYVVGKIVVIAVVRTALSRYEDLFVSTTIGATICVAVFSVLITSGRTVNILFLLLGGCILYVARNRHTANAGSREAPTTRQLGSVFFYAWLIYTFFAFVILRFSDWTSMLRTPALFDWGLYGADMTAMIRTAQENHTHVHLLLDQDYWGMTLYHFFEIWLAGIWHFFFPDLLPIYVLTLLSYSVCAFLALLGCWAFLQNLIQIRWYHRALVFAAFFCSGWFIVNSDFLNATAAAPFLGNLRDMNLFALFLPKRLAPFVFLLLSQLLFLRKQWASAFVSLLALPIVSVDTVPAVTGAVFLYGAVDAIRNRDHRKQWIGIAGIYFLFFVCLAALFKMFGNHKVMLYNPLPTMIKLFAPDPGTELFPFLFFGRAIVQLILLYSFHVAILIWIVRKRPELKQNVWLLSLLALSGAIGWGALYLYIDGIQFFISTLTIVQTLILVIAISLLSIAGRVPKLLVIFYLIGTALFNFFQFYAPVGGRASLGYSTAYLDRVSAGKPKSSVGISIEGEKDFETNWGIRNVMAHALGDMYVIFMPQYTKAVAINVFAVPETPFRPRMPKVPLLDIPLNYEAMDGFRSRMMKQSGIFYRFFTKLQQQRPNVTIEEAELAFIDYYKIDWGIVSIHAKISPSLERRVISLETDSTYGDRFIVLRNEPIQLHLD